MMIEYIAAIALAGALILGMAGPTFSANGEVQEETALLRTKVTLSQAISTAEQQTGGRRSTLVLMSITANRASSSRPMDPRVSKR